MGGVGSPLIKSWQVAFLVRDYPEELRTLGPRHFNGRIDDTFLASLKKTGDRVVLDFLSQDAPTRFIWVGFAIDAESRLDAIAEARHRLEGLIDGASFWGDNEWPMISEFVWVGESGDTDLRIVLHRRQIWIEMLNTAEESRAAWNRRNEELRSRVNRFFGLALDLHSRAMTPLGRQVRHSMRMFRHGKHSGSWGVEFICKFCALEGLVCGDEKQRKGEKLKSRLAALFRDSTSQFSDRIEKLWRYRSEAVHTARAFDAGGLDDGAPLGVHLEAIEYFFVGALVFALERIAAADDVTTLWQQVSDYALPDFARTERPRDFPKYAVPNMEVGTHIRMQGGGELLRQHLTAARAEYELKNPASTKPSYPIVVQSRGRGAKRPAETA